jgi:hypothetical protein
MTDDKAAPKPRPAAKSAQDREDRLKAALKANMARRKAQMRARSGQQGQDQDHNEQDKG